MEFMNLKQGDVTQFVSLSNFADKDDFNRNIEMWLLDHKSTFSKGELLGFKHLVRFAVKVPGVANPKIGTVLKEINKNCKDKEYNLLSRSTFKRMVVKGVTLGIFNSYETERKNGAQSSNLYVFNRYPEVKMRVIVEVVDNSVIQGEIIVQEIEKIEPVVSEIEPTTSFSNGTEPPMQQSVSHHKTINLLKTKKNKDINKRKDDLDSTFTSDFVPKPFIETVKPFFNKAKQIEEYWRMANIAAYRNDCETQKDQVLHIAIHSFKQMINKFKNGRVKNTFAYFYGILDKKFLDLYFEALYEIEVKGE